MSGKDDRETSKGSKKDDGGEQPGGRTPPEDNKAKIIRLFQEQELSPDVAEEDLEGWEKDDSWDGDLIEDSSEEWERLVQRPPTELELAQQMIYEAWDARGRARVRMARRALALSPDCADAYVLLADEAATSLEEAKTLYELGVQAGNRALGGNGIEDHVGQCWGIVETRPYMAARKGLAYTLWLMGERAEAIAHYTDMLRLNPGDNQGIRYILSLRLVEANDDAALEVLLAKYLRDPTADWAYTRALHRFRVRDAPGARRALRRAFEINPYVPNYLLGAKEMPEEMPDRVGYGDEREAVSYVDFALAGWRSSPGALEWLQAEVGDVTVAP